MFGSLDLSKGLDGFCGWHSVPTIEQKITTPSFIVDVVLTDPEDSEDRVGTLVFLGDASEIIQLNSIEGVSINWLYIFTPAWVNKSEEWKQEKVITMLTCEADEKAFAFQIDSGITYQCTDGVMYSDEVDEQVKYKPYLSFST